MKQLTKERKAEIESKKEEIWNRILTRLEKKGRVKDKSATLKKLMK
ncbi:hypothetical protein LPY66_16025 [Dehalobacter sp. DCM]|nr:hypothetical protein LPY66_16025 [Dehalobacter sp. DCM]